MFWDNVSGLYDLFETIYNGKVYRGLGRKVAEEIASDDVVLECACGTGAISRIIAPKCRKLIATDFSVGMLRQAARNCRACDNVRVRRADMTHLNCRDSSFDKVLEGNVINRMDDTCACGKEVARGGEQGGKIIVPTYINASAGVNRMAVRLLEMAGANFKRQYDLQSYRQFFADAGYEDVSYFVVDGRMPCAVAVITKEPLVF